VRRLGQYDAMYPFHVDSGPCYTNNTVWVVLYTEDMEHKAKDFQAGLSQLKDSLSVHSELNAISPLARYGHIVHFTIQQNAKYLSGIEALNFYEDFP
jgi:hypothetical protein